MNFGSSAGSTRVAPGVLNFMDLPLFTGRVALDAKGRPLVRMMSSSAVRICPWRRYLPTFSNGATNSIARLT